MSGKQKQRERLPKLVKHFRRLLIAQKRGEPTKGLEELIRYTSNNESEVLLAMHCSGLIDRVHYLEQAQQQMDRDITRQVLRTDLTSPERLLLWKALIDREERGVAAAQQKLEMERQKRFHPGD